MSNLNRFNALMYSDDEEDVRVAAPKAAPAPAPAPKKKDNRGNNNKGGRGRGRGRGYAPWLMALRPVYKLARVGEHIGLA